MTPTIGRIVIFHDVSGKDRPAIVLEVNQDGDATGYAAQTCDLGVFSDLGYGLVRNVVESEQIGGWSWPRLVVV